MMAHNHAMSGAVLWLTVAPNVGASTPLQLAGGTVMAAGAAQLPDLDHVKGRAATAWGPITGLLASWTVRAFGRRGHTHTLLAVAISAVATEASLRYGGAAALAVVALVSALAFIAWEDVIPGRWERFWPANLAASILFALWAVAVLDLSWLPAAVAVGWLAHLLGDMPTQRGVPLLWPLTGYRFRIGSFTTGERWETPVGILLLVGLGAAAALTAVAWPDAWTVTLV